MPRPPRCRRICDAPQVDTFCPQGHEEAAPILLTLDEYIRLVDLEQRTHQQCAAQMDISRSTVQEIYESARRKIAACLVYGRKLVITGGSYRICGGQEQARCKQGCRTKSEETHSNMQQHKGEANMKIAVTYANGQIFQHFGHTEQFKIYEIDGENTLICGGIGGGAQQALAQAGIRLFGGVSGDADAAVHALLAGNLGYNPNVRCDHHDHEHGEGGHTCGDHGCGHHGCH